MIRKYATAFTRTGTLSFVITSCGGTLSVTVRRSTRTILSMIGIRRKRPGPFGGDRRRPRRKMTPRSYSRAIRIDADATMKRTTRTAASAIRAATTRKLTPDSLVAVGGGRGGVASRPTGDRLLDAGDLED